MAVADGTISEKPLMQSVILLCHLYVNAPLPVDAALSVNAAGSPPEQIVWSEPTVPPVTKFTNKVASAEVAVPH